MSQEVAERIASLLRPELVRAYVEAHRSAFAAMAETRKKQQRAFESVLQQTADNFALFHKGAETLDDPSARVQLAQHLLKEHGVDIVAMLIANQAMHAGLKIPGASEKLGRLPASMRTPQGRDAVLEKLDSSCATPLSDLADSLAARSAGEFERLLPRACDACGVQLRPLDTKQERQLVLQHRQALMEMLSAERSPTDAVRRSAQLLACTRLGIVVDVPVKTVSALVAHLVTAAAGEEDAGVSALQEYHGQVRDYLLCLQRGAKAAATEKLAELERGLDGLRASVLAKAESGDEGEAAADESINAGSELGVEEPSVGDEGELLMRERDGKGDKAKKSKKGKTRAE
eukprot:COSAG03_NODE_1488_length_3988_cov_12.379789_2_plen_345_part_00